MLQVMHKSTEPCFVCKKTETARVRATGFSLFLCKDHAWEHIPPEPAPKPKKDKKGENGEPPKVESKKDLVKS
jgi:hypothetical protein